MFAKRAKNRTNMTTRSSTQAPPAEPAAPAGPEYYTGQTITPDEGAGHRIDSAADVDPNVKAYGLAGVFQGGGGGYGGAGTK
jgi:hypothetical protein